MQDEKKEFEYEQMQQDNHAEFFSLIAAYRGAYAAYSPMWYLDTLLLYVVWIKFVFLPDSSLKEVKI